MGRRFNSDKKLIFLILPFSYLFYYIWVRSSIGRTPACHAAWFTGSNPAVPAAKTPAIKESEMFPLKN